MPCTGMIRGGWGAPGFTEDGFQLDAERCFHPPMLFSQIPECMSNCTHGYSKLYGQKLQLFLCNTVPVQMVYEALSLEQLLNYGLEMFS